MEKVERVIKEVGLARAIVKEPEFIVVDEPISALDVLIRAQVLNLLKKFQRGRGLTPVHSTRPVDSALHKRLNCSCAQGQSYGNRGDGELFRYPMHPYTKSLMSAIPISDPILEKRKKLFVYEPKVYSADEEQPQLVDIGNSHMAFG